MGKEYIQVKNMIFPGKNPDLNSVEKYITDNISGQIIVSETGDIIQIGSKFASEYCGSTYTKKIWGALLKAKCNAVQILPELVESAENRRWIENKDEKHSNDAIGGWYRYDVRFSIPIFDNLGNHVMNNDYLATLVARINDKGIYLHDLINIKKEASTPFES